MITGDSKPTAGQVGEFCGEQLPSGAQNKVCKMLKQYTQQNPIYSSDG